MTRTLAWNAIRVSHTSRTRSRSRARILANLNLDPVTVAAGLLHDVLEDTRVSHDDLLKEFGEGDYCAC